MTLPHLLMNHERGTPIAEEQYDGDPPDGHVVKCYNVPSHICGEGILYFLLGVEKNAGFEIKKVLRPVKEETNLYPWKVICNEQFASFLLQKERIQIYDDIKRNNRILVRVPHGKETNGEEAATVQVDRGGDGTLNDTVEHGVAPKKEDTKWSIFRFINPQKNDADGDDGGRGDPSCYSSHVVSSAQNYDLGEVKKMNKGIFDTDSVSSNIGETAPGGDNSHLSLDREFATDSHQIGNGVEYRLYDESLLGGEDNRGGDGERDDDGDRSDESESDLSNDGNSDWFGSESSFAMDGEGIPQGRIRGLWRGERNRAEDGEEAASRMGQDRMGHKRRQGQHSANEDSQEEEEHYEESYRGSNYRNVKAQMGDDYYQRKDSFKWVESKKNSNTSDTKSGCELKSLVSSCRNEDTSVRNGEEGIMSSASSGRKWSGNIAPSDWVKAPHGGITHENKNDMEEDEMDEHNLKGKSRKKNATCDAIKGIINEQKELLKKIKRRKKMNKRGVAKINIYFCPGSMEEIITDIREEDAGVKVPTMIDFPLEEKRQFLLDAYGWTMEDHHHQDEDFQRPGHKIKWKRGNQHGDDEKHMGRATDMEEDDLLDQTCYKQGERQNREETSHRGQRHIREDTHHNGLHEERGSAFSGRSEERRRDGCDPKRGGSTIWPSHLGWKEISEQIKSKLCVVIKNKPAEWSDYDLRKFIESQFSGSNHFPVFEDIFLTKSCPTIATLAFKNERLRDHFLKCHKFKLPSSIRRYAHDGNRGGGNTTASYHYNSRYSNFLILQEYIVSHNASHINNAKKQPCQRKDGGGHSFVEKYKANHSEVAGTRMGESTSDDFSKSGRYKKHNNKYVSEMRSGSRQGSTGRPYERSETNRKMNQYGKHAHHTRS
ncbi:hypothetical protein AK88_00738 [Plasmodium fragile]|uniref:Uncharacterized protein n=1 Tax=Plasmodium fragile TaxID=5857 RepID=A0A0D9QRV0_PLAFR|nr:uncharacterized protein AK88_00738 [Plasmodium fragile]KJP89527.1 hypothetical protein AK88_00738 [Plasmodium fragile]